MNGDLISREALQETLARRVPYAIDTKEDVAFTQGLDAAYQAVLEAPAQDAEIVRHGRWIVRMCEDADPGELQCSNCGAGGPYDMCGVERESAYCPRCGAKMDAKEDA